MANLINVYDYRKAAKRILPRLVYDYLEGGAMDESLLVRNRRVLSDVRLLPRRLRDVSSRELGTELFARAVSAPLVISPTGLNGAFRPGGDLMLARAAARAGIPFTLSTPAQSTIEEVARQCSGEKWFQLYVVSRQLAESMVSRALDAGYSTLVLTTDVPINGKRERDIRNGFGLPFRFRARTVVDGALHPAWSWRFLRTGMPQLANFVSAEADTTEAQYAVLHRQMDAGFAWDDLRWLRETWPRTLLVKGILNADDAARAVELGADGIIVSNHGGRQEDGLPSPVEVLPSIRARVNCPILVDSGFRRGSDVVKALALGASAVGLGRAPLYGLAARGERGVDEVLAMVKAEIDTTLGLIGAASVSELDERFVWTPGLPDPSGRILVGSD